MAKAKAATASSSGTAHPDAISGTNRGSARSTEPMPIVGATPVDKEIDGAHDPVEYLDESGSANPTEDQIRECAYRCWVDRGSPEGNPEMDWHEAERKLRSASERS